MIKSAALSSFEKKINVQSDTVAPRIANLEKACLRPLPYPYTNFFSLSSDGDSPDVDGFVATAKVIREKYALPISDSYFPHFFYNRGIEADSSETETWFNPDYPLAGKFSKEKFFTDNFEWLKVFYQGATDTVHGWLLRNQLRVSRDVCLYRKKNIYNKLYRKCVTLKNKLKQYLPIVAHRHFHPEFYELKKIDFILPDEWHKIVPPRYLSFKYKNPVWGCQAFLLFKLGEQELARIEITSPEKGAPESLCSYEIDLHTILPKKKDILQNIEIYAGIIGYGRFEIIKPTLSTWLRSDIQEQATIMESFNLGVPLYTSHGGGYDIGHYKVNQSEAAHVAHYGECKDSPIYGLDIFDSFGIDFYNTASNTSKPTAVHIEDLTFPKLINNDQLIYDFDRYMRVPQNADGSYEMTVFTIDGHTYSPSIAEFAGWHVNDLLNNFNTNWTGGLVYTHLLSKPKMLRKEHTHTHENILNAETDLAVKNISENYFGLGEQQNIFVAPSSCLVRYSAILQQIEKFSYYSEDTNTLYISSWTDPIHGQQITDRQTLYRSLRYVTFYVKNSKDCKLFIDGVSFSGLIRNPKDATGRESVTIADCYTPKLILGKVPLSKRWKGEYSISEGKEIMTEGFRNSCFKASEQGKISLTLKPSNLDVSCTQYLRLKFGASSQVCNVNIQITLENGIVIKADPVLSENNDNDWVQPYSLMELNQPKDSFVFPAGSIKEICLNIVTAANSKVAIQEFSMLRDDDSPKTFGYLIGGKANKKYVGKTVIATTGKGAQYNTYVNNEGLYYFPAKFDRNDIVSLKLEVSERVYQYPVNGEYIEITQNDFNVNFA